MGKGKRNKKHQYMYEQNKNAIESFIKAVINKFNFTRFLCSASNDDLVQMYLDFFGKDKVSPEMATKFGDISKEDDLFVTRRGLTGLFQMLEKQKRYERRDNFLLWENKDYRSKKATFSLM